MKAENKERVALVTGSSRGLGRNIALSLAQAAGAVAVHYREKREEALEVAAEIGAVGVKSRAFQADLSLPGQAVKLISQVEENLGPVDILINNTGPLLVKPWAQVETEEAETVLRTNLFSAWETIKAALSGMRKRRWGRVINIGYSRVEQLTAFPTITAYAVAKTGLLILTRTAARTEASYGITVNMVSPGLLEGSILPKDEEVPAGRLGSFEDVSKALLFLISDEASYITGENLIVAGGWKL
ncbi:MAG: SDR family oxidoreductase [Candidatus Aminicenantaceae bacterium]